jgi:hypothetical protein
MFTHVVTGAYEGTELKLHSLLTSQEGDGQTYSVAAFSWGRGPHTLYISDRVHLVVCWMRRLKEKVPAPDGL